MLQKKFFLLYAVLLGVHVSFFAMDPSKSSLAARFQNDLTVHCWGDRDPLDEIRLRVGFAPLDQSVDQMLWQLRTGADPYEKDTQGTSFVDCLNHKKFVQHNGFKRHVLHAYLEPTSEIVWRSGCYRQTYPQRLMLIKPEAVFCECLVQEQSQEAGDEVALAECVASEVSLLPRVPAVLKCDALQKEPEYIFLRKIVASAEKASEQVKEQLWKKWKPMLADWHTFRICATLPDNTDSKLFQFALLQDDYDLVSYMVQHKMVTKESIVWARENTFFARTVPMLELLQQYGILSLVDDQNNTPLHHVAKHGRLMLAPVIDFYLKNGVDPLAANREGLTPLALLVQYSHRFNGCEPKLQKFVDMLLKRGARGQEVHAAYRKTLLEVAQAVHEVWNLPATALVSDTLQKQEILDKKYALFLKFRKAFSIQYPRVAGDTPLHTVVKMMLQKHDRLTEFVPSFKEMGYEERLAFFKNEFDTIEVLLKQGVDFKAQNSQGKTIFHTLCADWHMSIKQRAILYRKLLSLIFTCQTQLKEYHSLHDRDLEAKSDITLMSERLHMALALKDNQHVSPLDMVCDGRKPCAHDEYICLGSLLLGTTCTFKSRLIAFLRHELPIEEHETFKWVFGLYEEIKKK